MELGATPIISMGIVLNILIFGLNCTGEMENRVLRNILIAACLATFWGYAESLCISATFLTSGSITLCSILCLVVCNLGMLIMIDLLLLDFGLGDFKVSEIIGFICVFIISSSCWTIFLFN